MHTHTHTHTHMHTRACQDAHVVRWIDVMHQKLHLRTCAHNYACIHAQNVQMPYQINTWMQTYTHTHTHTHAYIFQHTCFINMYQVAGVSYRKIDPESTSREVWELHRSRPNWLNDPRVVYTQGTSTLSIQNRYGSVWKYVCVCTLFVVRHRNACTNMHVMISFLYVVYVRPYIPLCK